MAPATNFFTCQFCLFVFIFWMAEGIELQISSSDMKQNFNLSVTEISVYSNCDREKKFLFDYMASLWQGKPFVTLESENRIAKPSERINDYIRYSVARLGLSELTNIPKLRPDFGPVYNDILTFRYLITVPSCKISDTSASDVSLFIAVMSSATADAVNRKKRDELRVEFKKQIQANNDRIYAQKINPQPDNRPFTTVEYGFFFGRNPDDEIQSQIEQESRKNGDVVVMDVMESDSNSTLKMAALFNWMRKNCATVKVFLKMDENVGTVDFGRLAYISNDDSPGMDLLYGNGFGDTKPLRTNGPRQITVEEYPWKNYPYYPVGSAFFIKGRMIVPLMAAFQTTPMFPLDEVYLGICLVKAGYGMFSCGQFIKPDGF